MSPLTILALIVFVGYTLFTRFSPHTPTTPKSSPQVWGEETEATESAIAVASPKTSSIPAATASSKSHIDIKVDTNSGNANAATEKLVYPGASKIGDNLYETNADGDTVYSWYKAELDKRSFQIRNNVRTKANDKFKAVLQGVSGNTSIKVTIDQENSGAKTKITLE